MKSEFQNLLDRSPFPQNQIFLFDFIDTNEAGEVKIQLLSPAEIGFHYELSFFKSGNTTVDTGNLGKVPLSRYIDF